MPGALCIISFSHDKLYIIVLCGIYTIIRLSQAPYSSEASAGHFRPQTIANALPARVPKAKKKENLVL